LAPRLPPSKLGIILDMILGESSLIALAVSLGAASIFTFSFLLGILLSVV
jgi:hypothetical protein